MPRSFDLLAESPASVEEVHAAFGDEEYWLARLDAFGTGPGAATLDSLNVDSAGTVVVVTTFSLLSDRLPRLVTQLRRDGMAMVHTETWRLVGDNQVRGEVCIDVLGTPVSATGAAVLAPLNTGSRLQYSGKVKVKIPVVGAQIESFMSGRLAEGIMDIQQFTAAWIAENR